MIYKVAIVSIGNELLLGKTLNTNLAWLAAELSLLGLSVTCNIVIQDDDTQIRESISNAWHNNDIVFCTGGLGPTKDDITKAAITSVFDRELVFMPEIWQKVQTMFSHRGMQTPETNRSQALVPKGFNALDNARGTAPGLYYREGDKAFFALPGVPLEMQHIFQTSIKAILQETYSAKPIIQRTIHTWDISESALAERLEGFSCPQDVYLAWLPQTGRVDLRIYGSDPEAIETAFEDVRSLTADKIWGFDADTPYSVLQKTMLDRGLCLAVAESCTGGLLAQKITDHSGSSKFFMGGMIAYSNAIKTDLLQVQESTLEKHGAVSSQTAEEMAVGIKKLTKSDLAIAVTGIAGPNGGSVEKPVGTVFFGIADNAGIRSYGQFFSGNRSSIRLKASDFVVLRLIKDLKG